MCQPANAAYSASLRGRFASFDMKTNRIYTAVFAAITFALLTSCGQKSSDLVGVGHHLAVPSTNSYTILGPMRITGSGAGPDLLEYSTDGTNFSKMPYINHTFGDDKHWYEITVRDTPVWIYALAGVTTNGVPAEICFFPDTE